MAKKTPVSKTDHRTGNRASAAFQLLRQFVVRALASAGTPTVDIAKSLGLSRSFTIKQAHIVLKPRTAAEKRILKVATENEAKLKRMGIGGLLGGEDIITTLAGGERAKLGPLADRRAKREKASVKKTPTKKAAPPKRESSKVVKALVAPKLHTKATNPPLKGKAMDRMLGKVAVKAGAVPAAAAEAPKPARVRKGKPKASDLKAPLPAAKLVEDAPAPTSEQDDLLKDILSDGPAEGAPAPDAAI